MTACWWTLRHFNSRRKYLSLVQRPFFYFLLLLIRRHVVTIVRGLDGDHRVFYEIYIFYIPWLNREKWREAICCVASGVIPRRRRCRGPQEKSPRSPLLNVFRSTRLLYGWKHLSCIIFIFFFSGEKKTPFERALKSQVDVKSRLLLKRFSSSNACSRRNPPTFKNIRCTSHAFFLLKNLLTSYFHFKLAWDC